MSARRRKPFACEAGGLWVRANRDAKPGRAACPAAGTVRARGIRAPSGVTEQYHLIPGPGARECRLGIVAELTSPL
ncbi:hypothetical protein EVAR_74975_1 [Eumeta japonica]|uniref:Uncharacterized protein n=1 Tax=Eumeta variegata TaxID=151549 RepID=A0A4C1VBH6_EUMVA|nr:hypothetical protein EVAR_74975_1 [Eumeta japonica]